MFEPQQEREKAKSADVLALGRMPVTQAPGLPVWDTPAPDTVPDEVKNLRSWLGQVRVRQTIGGIQAGLMANVRRLHDQGRLKEVAALYAQGGKTSMHDDLQAALGAELDERQEVTLKLTSLGQTLDWHAFLEQLAIGAAYAQKDDLSDAKGGDGDTDLGAVIKAAGFTSRPLIRGRWGLQFRIFEPAGKVARGMRRLPIIAFRGTEGIRSPLNNPLNPATREGMIDTYIGDLTRMGAGYPQFQANRALIERRAKALGKSVMTGHSLGGGLAQIATAKLSQYTAECVTFAAPGIDRDDAEGLEDKRIPTTHHRTEGDVVPMAGDRAAPGEIVTYERYGTRDAGQTWQGPAGLTSVPANHNTTAVRGFLRGTAEGTRTSFEELLLNKGVASPNDAGLQASGSAVSSVRSTSRDNVKHQGHPVPYPGVTQQVFRANLGYTLLVEYVEAEVAKLDPAKRSKAEVGRALAALRTRVQELGSLPVTVESFGLYQDMGMDGFERSNEAYSDGKTLVVGQQIATQQADRIEVSLRVVGTWQAWWPGSLP